jgi:hypothetical protein
MEDKQQKMEEWAEKIRTKRHDVAAALLDLEEAKKVAKNKKEKYERLQSELDEILDVGPYGAEAEAVRQPLFNGLSDDDEDDDDFDDDEDEDEEEESSVSTEGETATYEPPLPDAEPATPLKIANGKVKIRLKHGIEETELLAGHVVEAVEDMGGDMLIESEDEDGEPYIVSQGEYELVETA